MSDIVWHRKSAEDVLTALKTSVASGLSDREVTKRLEEYGENIFERGEQDSILKLLIRQFKNPLVLVLALAFFATIYLGEHVDAVVILIALFVNVVIGFFQEFRASRAFEALVESQEHHAVVVRNGEQQVIQSKDLVPGDIIKVTAGNRIPADAYLLVSKDLSVSEASLTGESQPINKEAGSLPPATPMYKRTNMLYMGSNVFDGSGDAVVVATGRDAEIGALAHEVSMRGEAKTPIEVSVEKLARFLAVAVGIVVVAIWILGSMNGEPLTELLLLSVALAVSVVPEGLPAAVTAILAVGMEKILKERGLVKNLLGAQTLGSTTIVLTDKTGTLTQARMQVVDMVVSAPRLFTPESLIPEEKEMLAAALRVSDAFVSDTDGEVHGDPVERAVVEASIRSNIFNDIAPEREKRLDYLQFTSARRFAGALYANEGIHHAYYTGAPELLIEQADFILQNGKRVAFTKKTKEEFLNHVRLLAEEGKRLIAVSSSDTKRSEFLRGEKEQTLIKGTTFLGLLAFADPVRDDVPDAIQSVKDAGVRIVMVTGDNPQTALSIAKAAGIADSESKAITGFEIEELDDEELFEALETIPVFARILPHQKKRIVTVLQERGEVAAMTGDGVNDGPALSTAAIGVAVGSGTDVAKESSDLILLDDSFAIIESAIREGRRIMDNLKKAVSHLISTSFHEVFVILFSIIAGLPLPILPIQILWVNILEEGFLTFGFAFEPAESDVMKRNPRSETLKTILTKEVRKLIIVAGVVTGLFSIALFSWLISRGLPIEEIRTIMFVALSLDALLFAVSLKRLRLPFWTTSFTNNRYLIAALGFSAVGIVLTLFVPFLRDLLSLTIPNVFDVAVLTVVAIVNLLTIEVAKWFVFKNVKLTTWTPSQ